MPHYVLTNDGRKGWIISETKDHAIVSIEGKPVAFAANELKSDPRLNLIQDAIQDIEIMLDIHHRGEKVSEKVREDLVKCVEEAISNHNHKIDTDSQQ